ncbi:MAG: hypothetical protein M1818_001552 [Claussenomyces sp. TS43310]|nr:MAG: hypothetical protein M1818_001552 [Claussenomyces sp. TS43310]
MPSMPHKDRNGNVEERPSERRQRSKNDKDGHRSHKSSRSSRPKMIDPESGEAVRSSHRRRKDKGPDSEQTRSMVDVVPELARTSSAPGTTSRSSLPYPTFSKAHSKEMVNSRDDIRSTSAPKLNPFTPDPTDLGSDALKRTKSAGAAKTTGVAEGRKDARPPSPPDTEIFQQRNSAPSHSSRIREEAIPRSSSRTSLRSQISRSRLDEERSRLSNKSKGSKASTAVRTSKAKPARDRMVEDGHSNLSAEYDSAPDSNATSVAPAKPSPAAPGVKPPVMVVDTDSSPGSAHDSSPRTPTATPHLPHHDFKPAPSPFVSFDVDDSPPDAYDSPMPPPPPPPPMVPMNIPRVDYLMQNGGLPRPVPKNLLAVTPCQMSQGNPAMKRSAPILPDTAKVFAPYYTLLDQYEAVIAKHGSLAVATGYRSIARRLLDRLETVFARELSTEGCSCIMCQQDDRPDQAGGKALGWGDVLEWASSRREVPAWPAFDFLSMNLESEDSELDISGNQRTIDGSLRPASPVKIDPDIDEEFREHYLRASKKTKASVDKWLSSTPGSLSGPPPDINDDTLTFTILTHLSEEDRSIFNALMSGSSRPVQFASRAPTPMGKPRSDLVIRTGLSLQRLYRLPIPPRDPEVCIYLLKNPPFHNLLATIACINPSEWEILISGRFDGFLWSGAESEFPNSMLNSPAISRNQTPAQGPQSRGPTPAGRHPSFSRMNTPFSNAGINRSNTFSPASGFSSRGPTPSNYMAPTSMPTTPAPGRYPVSNDEETEIAVLAEVEREIYAGMEALEDAFEGLHRKAETVRRALRERGAGLSMMAQTRRGSANDGASFARLGTPALGDRGWDYNNGDSEVDIESDWGGDDVVSELAPDDSASNISSSKHRRPKRRNERRTPAPVEEEDEEEGEEKKDHA